MPEEKSFWKRYEFLIIAIVTLLFIYLLVVFNQKINFFLGNELIVYLTPNQKSFDMHYGDVSEIELGISIENVAYCKAACSYSFNDRSTNNAVDNGNFEIGKGQHFKKSYDLSVKRLGSGQDIYSFDVSCHSIKSFLCLTKGIEKSRSSLIIVNYDLTEIEKGLKENLKGNFTTLLNMLADVDILHQKINQKYFEYGFEANLNNLSKQKIDIDDKYDKTRISIENLRALWSVEDYNRLNQLFDRSFFETLEDIKKLIVELENSIEIIVKLHNKILSELDILLNDLRELGIFVGILEDDELSNKTYNNTEDFNKLAISVINNTFDNYQYVLDELTITTNNKNLIIERSKILSLELFLNYEYFLKFENDLLCSLKQDCKNNISISDLAKNIEQFSNTYPNKTPLKQNCNSLKDLEQKYSETRNEKLKLIADKNISFPVDNEFLELANNFKANEVIKINNSYYESLEKIRLDNKTAPEIIKAFESVLPKNKIVIKALDYNNSINISLYLLSRINVSDQTIELLTKCLKLEKQTKKIGNFDFQPISTNITYNIVSKIDTNLPENPPICCVFNECKPCCRDDSCKSNPKTFPVILLHGHSLAKDNSPEFSLDSFNKLQSKLQDGGYLNAGIVSLYSKNEVLQQGIWGLSGKPITVKVSYYYDAFKREDKYIVVPTKSENIDTYAVRLKDLIDIVKQRTNKPKVNIIAHSMGGLVARRYIQIFGEEDIDKLIMIATPNKGISGTIGEYCGLIGENRECQDMQENSLFINKLNDPFKQSKKVRLYAIIGQGCQMRLGNGDGVVLSDDVKLENARLYFVNGTCGGLFGTALHTEILDIENYPETYEIIKEILIV